MGAASLVSCSFDSYIARVAEVSVEENGTVRVNRIVSAVDCGTAVNPDGVRAMTEGAVNYALGPVLTGKITVKDGAVEQSNFHDYQVLRIDQALGRKTRVARTSRRTLAGCMRLLDRGDGVMSLNSAILSGH